MAGGGGQIQVVQVRGELDLATADSLAARGYAAIGRQARVLLLDLAGVSFCDARGLSALVRIAALEEEDDGTKLEVELTW
jgi:anti-anti-sigma factor